ncbi:Hsp20/alpha crystallin family protein [Xenophilus aerolatus]|nr:Hsp20/alpha crystallin family protein [Xenophilus aerolatus]
MNAIQTPRSTEPAAQQTGQASHDVDDALTPPVDVVEDAQGITLWADLPGVPKDRLRLEVEAGTLTIEGQMQLAMPDALQSSHREVASPRFRRVFTLSKELDTEQVSAELAHGVLTLRIPKARHAQARRIEVRVG